MSLDLGWRRFGEMPFPGDVSQTWSCNGTRGSSFWCCMEIAGSRYTAPLAGDGREWVSGTPSPVYVGSWDLPDGAMAIVGYIGGGTASVNSGWTLIAQGQTGSSGDTGAVWTTHTPGLFYPGSFSESWHPSNSCGGYLIVQGQVRQSGYSSDWLPGSSGHVDFAYPVVEGNLIVAFQAQGFYFSGGGYMEDPGYQYYLDHQYHNPWNIYPNGYQDPAGQWLYGCPYGGCSCSRFMWFWAQDPTPSSTPPSEGWMSEICLVTGATKVFTPKGQPGRGTVKVFSPEGKVLIQGVDWKWTGVGYQMKVLKGSYGHLEVTYLNMANRLTRGARNVRSTQSSSFHDRRRFPDIRGL